MEKSNVLPQITSLSLLAVNFLPCVSMLQIMPEGGNTLFPFWGWLHRGYPTRAAPPQAKKGEKLHQISFGLYTILVHFIAEWHVAAKQLLPLCSQTTDFVVRLQGLCEPWCFVPGNVRLELFAGGTITSLPLTCMCLVSLWVMVSRI